MWSCLLLADPETSPVVFSGVSVLPSEDPIGMVDWATRSGDEFVLVVAPRALAGPMRVAVTVTAGRRPDLAVASLVSDHAPMALLCALALARSVTDEPAIGVDLVRRLLAMSWSGAWTHSVTKLTEPNPGLGQHLRSLLPGGGFLVRQAPDAQVFSGLRGSAVGAVGLDRVLMVQDGAVPAPVSQQLAASDRITAVRQVAFPGVWTSVYGTDRAGQVALLPADPNAQLGAVSHQCPSCRLRQSAPSCPFCRILAAPAPTVRRQRSADPLPVPVVTASGPPTQPTPIGPLATRVGARRAMTTRSDDA